MTIIVPFLVNSNNKKWIYYPKIAFTFLWIQDECVKFVYFCMWSLCLRVAELSDDDPFGDNIDSAPHEPSDSFKVVKLKRFML